MSLSDGRPKKVAAIFVRRRLDDPYSGSFAYLLGFLDSLNQAGFEVHVLIGPISGFGSVPVSRPAGQIMDGGRKVVWPSTVNIFGYYVSTSRVVWMRGLRRAMRQIAWFLKGRPQGTRPSIQSDLGRKIGHGDYIALAREGNGLHPDLAVAEYASTADVLKEIATPHRAVLLHDLFHLRSESFRTVGLASDHNVPTLEEEIDRIRHADICIHASLAEAKFLELHLPEKRHLWLPPIPTAIPGISNASRRETGLPKFVFVGVRHGSNLDALELILKQIWPAVYAYKPEYELLVVGEIANALGRDAPPGVKKVARLDDLSELSGPNSIGIAPIRAASGISVKIVTYLSLGMPIIAFRQNLEAFGTALVDVVVGVETVDEFVTEMLALASDRERRVRLGNEGQALARGVLKANELHTLLSEIATEGTSKSPEKPAGSSAAP